MIPAHRHIELFTALTPNVIKVSTALDELELPYVARPIDLGKGEQKEDWFLQINPNGRIRAIVDRNNWTSQSDEVRFR